MEASKTDLAPKYYILQKKQTSYNLEKSNWSSICYDAAGLVASRSSLQFTNTVLVARRIAATKSIHNVNKNKNKQTK